MSEDECRHIPAAAWNPVVCGRCGATLSRTAGPATGAMLAEVRTALADDTRHTRAGLSLAVPYDVARAFLAEHEAAAQPAAPEPATPGWTAAGCAARREARMNNQPIVYDEETYDRVCAERDAALAKVERLLEAAGGALRMLDWHFDELAEHPEHCGCAVCGTRVNLRAAIAEHEAAARPERPA